MSALVTWGDAYLGTVGPFVVSEPWWSQVEPVVTHLREVLDVPVFVLRLLTVQGGEGGRDGHVTYHAAALERPPAGLERPAAGLERPAAGSERPLAGLPNPGPAGLAALTGPEDLRLPWARIEGLHEVLTWASDTLRTAGRPLTGPAEQYRTWNLSALFRLPTEQGLVWLKTTPPFAADEASVIAAFARVDPALVPSVIGAAPGRVLLDHLPGEAWTSRRPGCDPARALAVAEPLAHLAYAVRYQEFLDGIEPSAPP